MELRRMKYFRPSLDRAILAAFVALTILSCSSEAHVDPPAPSIPAQPAAYEPPIQVLNSTYAWSAAPEIDLFSERGKLIRASHESMMIAHYGGLDTTYPGFEDALHPEYASRVNTLHSRSLVGTIRAHILQILETDTGFKATVCTQRSGYAFSRKDGQYVTTHGSGSEEYVLFEYPTEEHELERSLHRRNEQSSSSAPEPEPLSLPATAHQWSAPTDDLFTDAGWIISFGGDFGETMHRCEAWGRSIEPDAPERGSETIVSPNPPETLPAFPGW